MNRKLLLAILALMIFIDPAFSESPDSSPSPHGTSAKHTEMSSVLIETQKLEKLYREEIAEVEKHQPDWNSKPFERTASQISQTSRNSSQTRLVGLSANCLSFRANHHLTKPEETLRTEWIEATYYYS